MNKSIIKKNIKTSLSSLRVASSRSLNDLLPNFSSSINDISHIAKSNYQEYKNPGVNLINSPEYRLSNESIKDIVKRLNSENLLEENDASDIFNESDESSEDISNAFKKPNKESNNSVNRQIKANNIFSEGIIKSNALGFSSVTSSINNIYKFNITNTLKFYNDVSDKLSIVSSSLSNIENIMTLQSQISLTTSKAISDPTEMMKKLFDPKSLMEEFSRYNSVGGSKKNIKGETKNTKYLSMGLTKGIGSLFGKSVKNLDLFSTFLPMIGTDFIEKMSKKDGIGGKGFGILKGLLGIDNTMTKKVDLRNKNDVTSFDTDTKKAITEVMPGYLSQILSSLNGGKEMVFDYRQGKFSEKGKMKKDFQKRFDSDSKGNDDITELLKSFSKGDNKKLNSLQNLMQKIILDDDSNIIGDIKSSKNNKDNKLKAYIDSDSTKKGAVTEETIQMLSSLGLSLSKTDLLKLQKNVYKSKKNVNNLLDPSKNPGISMLYNGYDPKNNHFDKNSEEEFEYSKKGFVDKKIHNYNKSKYGFDSLKTEEEKTPFFVKNKDQKGFGGKINNVLASIEEISNNLENGTKIGNKFKKFSNNVMDSILDIAYDNSIDILQKAEEKISGNKAFKALSRSKLKDKFDDIPNNNTNGNQETKTGSKSNITDKYEIYGINEGFASGGYVKKPIIAPIGENEPEFIIRDNEKVLSKLSRKIGSFFNKSNSSSSNTNNNDAESINTNLSLLAEVSSKLDTLDPILATISEFRNDFLISSNGGKPTGKNSSKFSLLKTGKSVLSKAGSIGRGIFGKIGSIIKPRFGSLNNKINNNSKKAMSGIKKNKNGFKDEDAENAEEARENEETANKNKEKNKERFSKYSEKFIDFFKNIKNGGFLKNLPIIGPLFSMLPGLASGAGGLVAGLAGKLLHGKSGKGGLKGLATKGVNATGGLLSKVGGLLSSKSAKGGKAGLIGKIG